jgi:hypothetical protein
MLNLKKAEIIGHHSYCEGSSRKMVVDASEDVWETQNQLWWEASSENGSLDHECLHTNIQIHGTPAKRKSLLNRRELCCIPSTLSKVPPGDHESRNGRPLENMHESNRGPILSLVPPARCACPDAFRPYLNGRVPLTSLK